MKKYALLTEAAMDAALTSASFSSETSLPNVGRAVHEVHVADNIVGFRVTVEPKNPFFALVGIRWIEQLAGEGVSPAEIFRRIARVVKGLASPPVHLPRQWSEYHYRNLLAFFALPREYSNVRWVADINGQLRCARFDFLSSDGTEVDLKRFAPAEWPIEFANQIEEFLSVRLKVVDVRDNASMAQEVDLQAIGSGSVVAGRTYEEWLRHLSAPQSEILTGAPSASIRIVGPAGSGKTLSLCMRALQISRRDDVIAQGQRILIATHSWAMSERIDGVLNSLNGGISPDGITVFPLLSLLELHVGHIGQRKTDVVGDDSSEGRLKSFEIIAKVLHRIDVSSHPNVSGWIKDGLSASPDSRIRLELVINLYDEISGVLTASGVAPDDQESIRDYMSGTREEWMPPFLLLADRGFVIAVYKLFIGDLVDRGAITTDQMILDSIRVLETFTWRMKRETEGYDYILVDELQLFDPQERAALELLGRTKGGVPFITAEDPSQGVFSALNSRRTNVDNVPVYLDTVHRFNKEIFEFINFVYRQFPL
ncbi:MAG: hypothetical protein Q8Q62_14090, partial [Mesorhizobium sp.]|nr:hypothetical protein [Mesorhizobium sp.]